MESCKHQCRPKRYSYRAAIGQCSTDSANSASIHSNACKEIFGKNSANAQLLVTLMNRAGIENQRAVEVLKECINRSEQDLLMFQALLSQECEVELPSFTEQDIEEFGRRAAYQSQLRFSNPLPRRAPQHEELERRISEDRSYNEVRGGLPVCATCTSNGGHTVTGHTADSAPCPFHVRVNPFHQHW